MIPYGKHCVEEVNGVSEPEPESLDVVESSDGMLNISFLLIYMGCSSR